VHAGESGLPTCALNDLAPSGHTAAPLPNGGWFRPPDKRRRIRCPECAASRWRGHRLDVEDSPAYQPPEVSTVATIRIDTSPNRTLVTLALVLATRAAPIPGLSSYVAGLNV